MEKLPPQDVEMRHWEFLSDIRSTVWESRVCKQLIDSARANWQRGVMPIEEAVFDAAICRAVALFIEGNLESNTVSLGPGYNVRIVSNGDEKFPTSSRSYLELARRFSELYYHNFYYPEIIERSSQRGKHPLVVTDSSGNDVELFTYHAQHYLGISDQSLLEGLRRMVRNPQVLFLPFDHGKPQGFINRRLCYPLHYSRPAFTYMKIRSGPPAVAFMGSEKNDYLTYALKTAFTLDIPFELLVQEQAHHEALEALLLDPLLQLQMKGSSHCWLKEGLAQLLGNPHVSLIQFINRWVGFDVRSPNGQILDYSSLQDRSIPLDYAASRCWVESLAEHLGAGELSRGLGNIVDRLYEGLSIRAEDYSARFNSPSELAETLFPEIAHPEIARRADELFIYYGALVQKYSSRYRATNGIMHDISHWTDLTPLWRPAPYASSFVEFWRGHLPDLIIDRLPYFGFTGHLQLYDFVTKRAV